MCAPPKGSIQQLAQKSCRFCWLLTLWNSNWGPEVQGSEDRHLFKIHSTAFIEHPLCAHHKHGNMEMNQVAFLRPPETEHMWMDQVQQSIILGALAGGT